MTHNTRRSFVLWGCVARYVCVVYTFVPCCNRHPYFVVLGLSLLFDTSILEVLPFFTHFLPVFTRTQ